MRKFVLLLFFLSIAGRLSSFLGPLGLPERFLTKSVWLPVLLLCIFLLFLKKQKYLKKLKSLYHDNIRLFQAWVFYLVVVVFSALLGFSKTESFLGAGYYALLSSIPVLFIVFSKKDRDSVLKFLFATTLILVSVAFVQYFDYRLNQNNGQIVQFFSGGGFVPLDFFNIRTSHSGLFLRPSSLMVDPNIFATFLALPILLAINSLRRREFLGLAALTLGASVFALFLTASRTGFISLIVGLVVYWLMSSKGRQLIFAGFPGVFDRLWQRLSTLLTFSDGSSITHLTFASGAIRMFRDYPILGVGVGAYPEYYQAVIDRSVGYATAHSAYLRVIAETGLMGAASFVLFILELVKTALKKRSPVLVAVLAAILVGNITYDYFMTPWVWFFIGLILSDMEF